MSDIPSHPCAHHYMPHHQTHEWRARIVMLLSLVMMVTEVIAGYISGSMALLADGWHMAGDVFAMGLTLFTYRFARKQALNSNYSFGTGKANALGSFASDITLLFLAFMLITDSLMRFFHPEAIMLNAALSVAVIGLVINILCALLLKENHHHSGVDHHHHDHNLYAAYLHAIGDGVTSVAAISALLVGKYFGIMWTDSLAGILGGLFIGYFAIGQLQVTGRLLLDRIPDETLAHEIRSIIEKDGDKLADFHLWPLSPQHYAAILSIETAFPQAPEHYKERLKHVGMLSHITVEISTPYGNNLSEPTTLPLS